ncbi:hypothetical protein AX17_000274 [Amanita inopinata Kibby_2008]|nr:hypothetical protein AX17_000274 [Amanita inopinata Kibby_2008]
MSVRQDSDHAPRLGGKLSVGLFIFTLLAFVAETQLTQYVQTTLGYRQPFFLFYIVHSSFWIIFPLHLLYLALTTDYTVSSLLKGISLAITDHLSPRESLDGPFPYYAFSRLVFFMFAGLTCPGLLWFASITLASISDVTAIWNTNAFFAYILTVKLFHLSWEPRRLVAVLLATLGVAAVVYGGSSHSESPDSRKTSVRAATGIRIRPSAPLLGDTLTLVASFGYGLYQVLYKKYVALPSDPEMASNRLYHQVPEDDVNRGSCDTDTAEADKKSAIYPPPFGLHPNLLTSLIGFLTFAILWIPLPFLHHFSIEPFRLPDNPKTVLAISGIAISGVVFNAGFMVLLGIWGPVVTSVGNLLTIVLVSLADLFFGAGTQNFTLWSLVGCSIITSAFGILAYDMFRKSSDVA